MRFRIAAAGVLAAGALAATAVATLQAGHAQAAAATATPVKHVVVIYMENHSFDNVLGFWCDQPAQQAAGRCPDGGMPSSVTLSDGSVVVPSSDPDTVPNVNHSVQSQLAAMDGGKMDGWQNIQGGTCDASAGYRCISGYQAGQIPDIASLASTFAISDKTFSFADSPSWGGHVYAVAGTLDHFTGNNPSFPKNATFQGPGWGCDSGRLAKWVNPSTGVIENVPSCVPKYLPGLAHGGAFKATPVQHVPTIMDRLGAAGQSWKIYGASPGQQGYIWATCPTFADCLDTSQDASVVPSAQFETDAQAGSLPAFSVVTPGGATYAGSCHNLMSMADCDNTVGAEVQAVEGGPDWASTAIFITWDDFGGFYDQVPPPAGLNPDGQQAGPRVPLIIVSPYAKPGYTDDTATSFAGILAYTEHVFGLKPLTVNDAHAYDFSGAFDYSQAPLRPARMTRQKLTRAEQRVVAHPPAVVNNDPS